MNFRKLQIDKTHWRLAGQRLIEMAIAEFLYEEIIQAQQINQIEQGCAMYQLQLNREIYQFLGQPYLLGHWQIIPGSVRHLGYSHTDPAWDLHAFIHAFAVEAEVKPFTQAYLIKEMNNTWLAEAHLFNQNRRNSADVLYLSHDQIEGMLRGHPWLIMSKGRMGFGYDDYLDAAPELSPQVKVLWLAVHQDLAQYHGTRTWTAEQLYQHELGEDERQLFQQKLQQLQLNPEAYFLIPVHAWQWHQWLVPTYANEIVNQRIVELELGQDDYVPMQSIRTLYNVSYPQRHYVKLPVSIFNTAVYRGLPSQRNLAAPAVTEWLQELLAQDQDLQSTGVVFLGEIATLTIAQPCYDQIDGAPYQFKELFGCLWRESVERHVQPGQQVLSQAALLHRDQKGESILSVLIHASGLSPLQWLNQFVRVGLTPLLLCLYKYGLAFSPHGENTMLIHEHGVPKALVLKDFIDDVNLVDEDFPELSNLPAEGSILLRHPAHELSHFIFTGLFMVHYRYIANVFLQDFPQHSEFEFWQTVSQVIEEVHQQYPELQARIDKFAMLREQYDKICLNRVRLFTTSYNDEAERPVPVFLDPIANPVSPQTLQQWQTKLQSASTLKESITV